MDCVENDVSHCIAMKGGLQFTEPLTSHDRSDTYTDTQTDGRDLLNTMRWARLPCVHQKTASGIQTFLLIIMQQN
jgi:hypothetical protein